MPPNRFESEVESFLEGSHGDRTHIKRADHHTVTPLCGTLLSPAPQSRKVDVSPTHFVHPQSWPPTTLNQTFSHRKAERSGSDQLFLSFNPEISRLECFENVQRLVASGASLTEAATTATTPTPEPTSTTPSPGPKTGTRPEPKPSKMARVRALCIGWS